MGPPRDREFGQSAQNPQIQHYSKCPLLGVNTLSIAMSAGSNDDGSGGDSDEGERGAAPEEGATAVEQPAENSVAVEQRNMAYGMESI